MESTVKDSQLATGQQRPQQEGRSAMAHFRGSIQGQREPTSRLGSKNSGLLVLAQSWDGQVRVQLYEENGQDCARIVVEGHNGAGPIGKVLAEGTIKELREG